jgi:hypothetical protein
MPDAAHRVPERWISGVNLYSMRQEPLSESFAAILRSDAVGALAAVFIIGTH